MSAVNRVVELGHVNLWVRDVDRASAFYCEALGFHEVARGSLNGVRVVFLTLGTRHHDLALAELREGAGGPGLNHIGLKVGDDLEALRRMSNALSGAGIVPSRYVDHRVCQSMHVRDPDGHLVELYVDGDPTLWRRTPQAMVCADPLVLD